MLKRLRRHDFLAGNCRLSAWDRASSWSSALHCLYEAVEHGPRPDRIGYHTAPRISAPKSLEHMDLKMKNDENGLDPSDLLEI